MNAPSLPVLLVGSFRATAEAPRGVCDELAARLPQAGCAVLTTSTKRAKVSRLTDMIGTAWRHRHRYAVAQVDVFSGNAFVWAEAVCAALRLARKPYILTLHGGSLPVFADRNPVRMRRLLRSAAVVTTPSRFLLERFAGDRPDLRFIPNGLDLDDYRPRPRARVEPKLVWLRAFHTIYNSPLAVRILPIIASRYPNVSLTMIGEDKGDGSLQTTQRTAADLGVSDRVRFSPAVAKRDVPAAMNGGDIYLNTTNVDSAPVTVVEAMACGLCVVTTKVGGIPHLVTHEREALLVPPDDPDAMAGAVLKILDDPALADRLSRQGREKAERFDWPPIVAEWRSLLAATAAAAA